MWRAKASKGGETNSFRNELCGEQRLVREGETNNSFRNELCGEQRLVREGETNNSFRNELWRAKAETNKTKTVFNMMSYGTKTVVVKNIYYNFFSSNNK